MAFSVAMHCFGVHCRSRGIVAHPGQDKRPVRFKVELQRPGKPPDPKRLVFVTRGTRQPLGANGQVERVMVPLEHEAVSGETPQQWLAAPRLGEPTRLPGKLGAGWSG